MNFRVTVFTVLFCSILGFTHNLTAKQSDRITPNQFYGSDVERIQAALDSANRAGLPLVIPSENSRGTNCWIIDSAILLSSNSPLILDNCTIQLSDSCRDNMFRSANVGIGIEDPDWISNITIVGLGEVLLKGADNPRSTGDGHRVLTLSPETATHWRKSYGTDAGKEGRKQKGDWRNNMIMIAYVDGFILRNVTVERSHGWAISFERTHNAEISDIRFRNPEVNIIDGVEKKIYNRDGINLRHGCKYFRIDNINGINGDDLIALTSLSGEKTSGSLNSTQVTAAKWSGADDDTEQVFITNCQTNYTGVGIRASGEASIHNVYIDGVVTKARPDTPPPYGGSPYTLLVGGTGYGVPSIPGKIHSIYAMNLMGDGKSLILVQSAIANSVFMNGVYRGDAPEAITYTIDKSETKNITEINLIKIDY